MPRGSALRGGRGRSPTQRTTAQWLLAEGNDRARRGRNVEAGLRLIGSGVEAGCPVGDRAYSSEGLRERGIDTGCGRAENDYENEERARAEEWPTEYTEYTERGTGGGRRKRTITRTRNDRGRRSGPRNTRKGGRDPEAEGGKLA